VDRFFVVGNTFLISMYGKPYQFQIINAQTEKVTQNLVYKVSHSTAFTVEGEEPPVEKIKKREVDFSWESIGGLREQVQVIREMVETTIKSPEMFQSYGKIF
jgi:ATP-dependent 26S proteasome regulatory subunit